MNWHRIFIRTTYITLLAGTVVITLFIILLLQSKINIFKFGENQITETEKVEPFPVSVNINTETITENPAIETFFSETLALSPNSKNKWWNQVASVFATKVWYQNLASPVSRIIVIWPGERKEEAINNIASILRWDKDDKAEFENLVDSSQPVMPEGKYFPGQYVTHRHSTPEEIYQLIEDKFKTEILSRYTPEVSSQVPLDQALIVASLLEREASDFQNMREVSGVIWNRLFIDMPLQLDATLQYARGSNTYEPKWWPIVVPRDKYINSPFNTYKNEGLPPAPIANPSTEAILAALNPIATDCIYYFHTEDGGYHCSTNYKDHVSKLRAIYGRGS